MTDPAGVRVVTFGDDALLVEVADLAAVRRLDDALRAARQDHRGPTGRSGRTADSDPVDPSSPSAAPDPWAAVVDQVPAARTVLLRTRPGADLAALAAAVVRTWRSSRTHPAPEAPTTALVTLDVVYDGADLEEVAAITGCTADEVVARHCTPTYTVAFGGFMPGFAYLVGLDPQLHVPRRDSPRERVPAGSVAIADEYSAVYPAPTPGGWRLLGRCGADLFDVNRTPPALLAPGTRVRFTPVARA
ncbi:allophanate hydrolase subunit 1 [Cellulomonas sp.]|uniref:5-oxoprolinase subunit B family protein n=1 Tax=Cellulomonas sp. TaxID=40001 RepID=UPI001B01152E|nr:allophanate hydrolase subunit 1 [Cellulomonas sp.]MBO9555456.1 allophanate hydrolase subunit 1 [Cellulomonas sp.]